MINFDEIITDINKVQSINLAIIIQAVNVMLLEYANPIIFTLSASGSALYIWLKIRKEFFNKKEEKK
jgi:hypothetical protein